MELSSINSALAWTWTQDLSRDSAVRKPLPYWRNLTAWIIWLNSSWEFFCDIGAPLCACVLVVGNVCICIMYVWQLSGVFVILWLRLWCDTSDWANWVDVCHFTALNFSGPTKGLNLKLCMWRASYELDVHPFLIWQNRQLVLRKM